MKFLPIKSLIQFRSVSKQWNSFITSSEFIADYHVINTQPPEHLFVRYAQSCEQKHVSFVDDDTFPKNKFSLPVLSSVRKLYDRVHVIGSSNGLFLFRLHDIYDNSTALIWNPTVRKSVDIDLGIVFDPSYKTVNGFSVTPHTIDPIMVKVTCLYNDSDYEDVSIDDINYVPWHVEVFKISSGVWRSPLCNNLPRDTIQLTSSGVDINGYIYFLAFEWIAIKVKTSWAK